MLKITLTCPASLPATQFGGILFLCVDIARELSNIGHDIKIYTTDMDFANNPKTFNKKLPHIQKIENFMIYRSHVWFSIKLFFVNPGMYFQMLIDKPDIIHSIGIRSFQSLVGALIAKKKKIPFVISDQGGLTSHPDLNNRKMNLLYKLQKPMIQFLIKEAAIVIVANEYEKEIFLKLCDESKIKIVKNGINLKALELYSENFREKYCIHDQYILFLGRFSKVKGIDVLLHAIHILKNKREMMNVKLVIMGVDFGYEKEMLKMIDLLDIQNKTKVIKNPPREDVIAAYRECRFLVLPSRWELSPLTPLEAFAFKKPVISTKIHGIPYTINDKKNCILVEPENAQLLANAIIELLKDNKKCEEYGMNGYNLVNNTCNSKEMSKQILQIYQQLVIGKKSKTD